MSFSNVRELKISVADKFFYNSNLVLRWGTPSIVWSFLYFMTEFYHPFGSLERVAGLTSTAITSLPFPRSSTPAGRTVAGCSESIVRSMLLPTTLDGILSMHF